MISGIAINRLGNGLKFDGVDDYVSVPYFAGIDFEKTDPFTISGIGIIYDSPSFAGIIGKTFPGNGTGWELNIVKIDSTSFQLAFSFAVGGSLIRAVSSTSFKFGELFHFVAVSTTGLSPGFKFYKNNLLLTPTPTHASAIGAIKNNSPMTIGRFGDTNSLPGYVNLNGILYDLKIFSRVLTDPEMAQLYTSDNVYTSAMPAIVWGTSFETKAEQ